MLGTQMRGMSSNNIMVQNFEQTKNNLGTSQMKQPVAGLGATKADQTSHKPVLGALSKA